MNAAVGCEHAARPGAKRLAVDGADRAARLLDDERAGGDIPGLKLHLVERVDTPAGDVAEIDRGGSQAPDCAGTADERLEQPHQFTGILVHAVMKSGDQQRIDQRVRGGRHADRKSVQPRALPALCGEQLAAVRVVDGADGKLAVDFERQRGAEDRQAVREVRGAVDRIEQPAELRGAVALAGFVELFAEHGVIGKALGDGVAKGPLDRDVDFCDEIDGAFLVDADVAAERGQLRLAGANHGFDGSGEKDWIEISHQTRGS